MYMFSQEDIPAYENHLHPKHWQSEDLVRFFNMPHLPKIKCYSSPVPLTKCIHLYTYDNDCLTISKNQLVCKHVQTPAAETKGIT